MTTEGDGNYQLQRFLEGEGAEADIQLVTAWLLYMLWEGRNDTKERADLRGVDGGKYGLGTSTSARSARSALAGRPGHPRARSRPSRTPSASTATTCPTWTRSPRSRTTTTTTICAAAKATWRSAS